MGTWLDEGYERQTPPRRGQCIAITLDGTARPYDISALLMGGFTPEASLARRCEVYLTLAAETATAYFYFHSATASDLDNAATIAAGSAITLATTHAYILPAGQEKRFCIDRSVDRFLIVKGSGAGTLRISPSSVASLISG